MKQRKNKIKINFFSKILLKFIGYLKESIGYCFYHCIDKTLFVSKHAIFPDKKFVLKKSSERKIELEDV